MNKNCGKIKRGSFTNLFISQLVSVIECQTWFLINAKTHDIHQMMQYANNLIHIFKNIDENMRNSIKAQWLETAVVGSSTWQGGTYVPATLR